MLRSQSLAKLVEFATLSALSALLNSLNSPHNNNLSLPSRVFRLLSSPLARCLINQS